MGEDEPGGGVPQESSGEEESSGLEGLRGDIEGKMSEGADKLGELRDQLSEGKITKEKADQKAKKIIEQHEGLVKHRRSITRRPPKEDE